MSLHFIDYAVIVLYAVVIGGVGLWMARKQKSTDEYFVAARTIPGWAVAFTLFATLISSGTVIGHPATVYQKGMILLLGHMMLAVVLIPVAIWIVPFYRNTVRMSAYEYIHRRFGPGCRVYSSFGFLADRIFDMGVTILTTAIPIQFMTGWALIPTIIVTGAFTIVYTAIGGIQGVVWTDVVQGVLIVAGAALLLVRVIFAPEAGGASAVLGEAWRAGKFSLGSFDLSWQSLFDKEHTSQWLFLLAFIINWGRRYIADQHMVQRYLIAKTDRDAQRGTIVNALMCVPIYLAFMTAGACLYGFYKLAPVAPPNLPDNVVPYFIVHEMPRGIIGLMLAAILAASMSSLSGDLNSVATVLTTDYFARLMPNLSDRDRLWIGRGTVIAGGALACMVALLMVPKAGTASIMERVVTVAAVLSSGTLGLFFLGFLTRRATRIGAYIGIACCLLFTAWGILTTSQLVKLPINFTMNPILIGVFGQFIVFGVGYLASLIFREPPPDDIERLTWHR